MPHFDRFDICEAYLVMEWDWHSGGWLQERESNVRRGKRRGYIGEATSIQLERIHFRPAPSLCYDTLSENGKEIYHMLEERYGFPSTRKEE
jgi:hypothetical protein